MQFLKFLSNRISLNSIGYLPTQNHLRSHMFISQTFAKHNSVSPGLDTHTKLFEGFFSQFRSCAREYLSWKKERSL